MGLEQKNKAGERCAMQNCYVGLGKYFSLSFRDAYGSMRNYSSGKDINQIRNYLERL